MRWLLGRFIPFLDADLKVPNDISVISVDNSRMASMVRPQLTAVAQPMYDIGAVSMRLLTKLMKKENVEESKVILPHDIIVRQSVGRI